MAADHANKEIVNIMIGSEGHAWSFEGNEGHTELALM